jgi:hypothetical protein
MSKKADNQFFVPHNVLEEDKFLSLSLSAQILYVHLCRIKNIMERCKRLKNDRFFRDIKTLSRETKLNKNTVSKAKQELLKAEYIGIERDSYKASGHRSADVFHLNGYRFKID